MPEGARATSRRRPEPAGRDQAAEPPGAKLRAEHGRCRRPLRPVEDTFRVEVGRESEGRWFADVVALPGVMTYGATADEAFSGAIALALRVIAERLEHREAIPGLAADGAQALDLRFARVA